jgi:hypothetical protein
MLFGDERKELEVGNKSIQINKLFKSKSRTFKLLYEPYRFVHEIYNSNTHKY